MPTNNQSPEEELAILKEEFRLADTDNSGLLSADEVKELLKTNLSLPMRYLHKNAFKKADKDNSGEINFEEYCTLRKKFAGIAFTFPPSAGAKTEEEIEYAPTAPTAPPAPGFDDISRLLKADMQSQDDGVALNGLLALEKRIGSKEASVYFAGLGGHTQLVLLTKKWKGHQRILNSLCWLIMRFVHEYGKGDLNAASSMIDSGAIEAVVVAMQHFPTFPDNQANGMNAIGNLLWSCGDHAKYVGQFVDHHDGLALTCKAMNAFPKNRYLQDAACSLFSQLCGGGANDKVLTAESLALLCRAVLNFSDNDRIKERVRHVVNVTLL